MGEHQQLHEDDVDVELLNYLLELVEQPDVLFLYLQHFPPDLVDQVVQLHHLLLLPLLVLRILSQLILRPLYPVHQLVDLYHVQDLSCHPPAVIPVNHLLLLAIQDQQGIQLLVNLNVPLLSSLNLGNQLLVAALMGRLTVGY